MKDARIGNSMEIQEDPRVQKMFEYSERSLLEGNMSIFSRIKSEYVLYRQMMFFDDEDYEIMCSDLTKSSDDLRTSYKDKFNELTKKFPYLEEKNLKKEFDIQIISYTLSDSVVQYYINISRSKKELISLLEADAKYVKKHNKFSMDKDKNDFLLKIKKELMEKLNVVESDFNMCFASNAFVQIIK